ncbi:GroES-like protein [Amniculicola lignicola CBS 123094]|uniref:GroES-like protein n=1 Tax=Amniculicola lignicola CBS 123094 TaxID=1392246 RepID=A0A6A5WI65_9PLEO|nr:GroES-like protein [Amniculicola lignicola CBS 123094]
MSSASTTVSFSPSNAPRYLKPLLVVSKGIYAIEPAHPVPALLSNDEVLIKTHTVGLNPIIWKSVAYNFCLPEYPWITGRELAGTVAAVGSAITNLAVRDHVWTSTRYKDARAGCFQEYVAVRGHAVMPLPQHIPLESANCPGVAGLTAAMNL